MNLAALIESHPEDGRALYDGGSWRTWGELRRRTASTVAGLTGLGVGPGDRVAIAWPTSVDFVVAYLAVLAAGAVAVPLNPNSPPAELVRELDVVTPTVLLAGGAAAAVASTVAADLDSALTVVRPGGSPSWEAVSGADTAAATPGADGDPAAATGPPLTVVDRGDDEVAVLLFTSGTSGSPKAAMLSHGNLRANLEQMLALPGEIVRADDVSLAAVPLFHVFGLNVALGLTLAAGAGLILEERFNAADSLRLVRELGVTNVVGVPAMFAAWVALAEDDPAAAAGGGAGADSGLPGVRRAVSGAAALPVEVAAGFEKAFGVPVWQGYGLTEAAPAVTTALGTGRNRPGSVGLPLPGVTVRLVDEADEDVLDGDPGEIWVKGANVFAGYWGDEAASAAAVTADGWLRTGDIGVIGEDGDLFVVDRSKDLVIVSGFNVYPAEVEKVVAALDGVAEVVMVGRPDPNTGESVDLVIVKAEGSRLSEEEVHDHCAARLARYKCPTTVRFVSELPHGLAGKALRRALREQVL